MQVANVRTFDTPEFAGMQFLEVEASSALNRVKGMGFAWSINPYRGCSHACHFCQSGDTTVLMADGRPSPIAELRAGDEVYGTIQAGPYRRYVVTKVLDHWQTMKPAYRVTLADGTRLIASGDHRFLSNRGWKHVAPAERPAQRPFLTTNNRLIGTGAFEEGPKDSTDYRRGYLCGMIRGDGSLSDGTGVTRTGRPRTAHAFRLALVDIEGLVRTRRYLSDAGVETREFEFSKKTPTRQALRAIGVSGRQAIQRISDLIAWPTQRSEEWEKGFLAGIFDAEGCYSAVSAMRICNSDEVILDAVMAGLRRFHIPHVLERPMSNGCRNVRVRGGLRQCLRFFHITDPAIRRKCNLEGRAVKGPSDLKVEAIEPLGIEMPMYDITTGTGDFIANGVISHNCFARPTHTYLNLNPLEDFEKTIVVKTNVAEVLRRELAKPSWKGERVAMGTNTDPYQRCEGRYELMPGIIRNLAESLTPFSILTKGTLITRDIKLLSEAAERVPVTAAMTIGMLDETLWRSSEPGTPSPAARLSAVRALNDAGIPTGVMLAPIMPGLNDDKEQLAALVHRIAAAGATHITPIVLHLRPGVREVFWPWLEREHPDLVARYQRLYTRSNAPDDYRKAVTAFVAQERTKAWRRYGRPSAPTILDADVQTARGPRDSDDGEQLRLL
jgi:DNA repair photolyase